MVEFLPFYFFLFVTFPTFQCRYVYQYLNFLQKTTERERYSAFRSFLLLADYLCQILKYFLEAFQEFLCFIHAEAQRRQQAKYIRTAYTGEYMLLFQ